MKTLHTRDAVMSRQDRGDSFWDNCVDRIPGIQKCVFVPFDLTWAFIPTMVNYSGGLILVVVLIANKNPAWNPTDFFMSPVSI